MQIRLGAYVALSHNSTILLLAFVVAASVTRGKDKPTAVRLAACTLFIGMVGLGITGWLVWDALRSAGGALPNTCLACGAHCQVEPSSLVPWATLDELNGRLQDCRLVHCWDATEAELGSYYTPFSTSLQVAAQMQQRIPQSPAVAASSLKARNSASSSSLQSSERVSSPSFARACARSLTCRCASGRATCWLQSQRECARRLSSWWQAYR